MIATGPWRKSSRSQSNGSACVEARLHGTTPQLSDSKLPHDRPILALAVADYRGFITAIKSDPLRFSALPAATVVFVQAATHG